MRADVRRLVLWASLVAPSAAVHAQVAKDSARAAADSLRSGGGMSGTVVVEKDTLRLGDREVAAGTTVRGPIVVAGGDLLVRGTVEGNAVVIAGDIHVAPGGRITGDALAVVGGVRKEGGSVGGQTRAFASELTSSFRVFQRSAVKSPGTVGALRLVLGWLVVILLVGLGVLVFAGRYLDGVVDVLEADFWRALWVGVAGELALLPALTLVVVALCVTVIGILLVPFAVVAFVVATVGLLTLGFLAVARLTGHSLGSSAAQRLSARGSALRALILGVAVYLGVWVVAAAMSWAPMPSAVLRALALAITWVAATAGFGAALVSRGGTRQAGAAPAPAAGPDAVGWQTPTPVTGVAVARRPAPTARDRAS